MAVGARRIHAPDVLHEAYDYSAFRRFVVDPLGPGGDRRCRFAFFSSYLDEFMAAAWTAVEPDAVVIVDGGLLLRPELVAAWDLIIWLDTDPETCVRRARARDVSWVGDADAVERRYRTRNLPMHEIYIAETGGPARAEIVIDNADPARPRVLRWSTARPRQTQALAD